MDKQLREFLQIAKKKTFASRISIPKPKKKGEREYSYKNGDFLYIDRYYGSELDNGQELVFYKNKLIWSMSYRGGMLSGYRNIARQCFSFLKKCLRDAPLDFPVRGPKECLGKKFKYVNNWTGDITDFTGEEKMYLNGTQIYFRDYLGGSSEC